MKAVIYARYSSNNQREESIEGQIRECTAFAEKNGITILKHYIDRSYYKCVSVKKKRTDCIKKAIKKDFIEEFVVRHTMKMLADDKAIEAIIAMLMDLQERENANLPLYEQQLRDVERNIENLLDAIQQGIFTKSTKGRLDELEVAKEDLEIRIANEKIAKPKLTEKKIKHFLYRFRTLDMTKKKHRQLLIDMFINRIYLYDDKLVITFNHKDGAETITLEDIETALAEAGVRFGFG